MLLRFISYVVVLGLVGLLACTYWAGRAATAIAPSLPSVGTTDAHPRKLLMQYCGSCHEGGRTDFDFDDASLSPEQMRRDHAIWELAAQKLREQKMPPRKSTQPSADERQAILHWLEETVLKATANAGRLRVRRLQRVAYLNIVRDLFGKSIKPRVDLPRDEPAWAVCDQLPALAPEHLAVYRSAAKQILDAAFVEPSPGSAANAGEEEDMNAPGEVVAAGAAHMFSERAHGTSAHSARDVLAAFARRAYHEPVGATELDRLCKVFEQASANGTSFDDSLSAALVEVMTSPRFLFRVDFRDEGPQVLDAAPCNEFELAARLSFFLWSSVPDDELLDHAQAETLRQHLASQVKRMLRDPRAKALAKGFASFWLGLDKLDAANSDDNLRRAMKKETNMFVRAIVREDRGVLDFLDADFTFLNESLAKHYGIAGVDGDRFRRVSLHGTGRGGLITQGSVLTLTTKTNQTSPVIRGKWVLEKFFGESLAGPPVDVMKLGAPPGQAGSALFQNATCAQCHARMDPIGCTLENFDSLGRWRSRRADTPINPTGVLPDGETLHGPVALKDYLVRHHDLFVRALREKLASYALGHRLSDCERQAVAAIPLSVAKDGLQFSRVILEVVQSGPFQTGQGVAAH